MQLTPDNLSKKDQDLLAQVKSSDQNLGLISEPLKSKLRSQNRTNRKVSGGSARQPSTKMLNEMIQLFNEGQLEACETLAVNITDQYPESGLGWKVLGTIYQQKNLSDQALNALTKAVGLVPNDAEVHYNIANLYFDLKILDLAVLHYKKSIKLSKSFIHAYFNLGSVFKEKGNFEQAELNFKEALKLEENNVELILNLVSVLTELDKCSEAITLLKHAVVLDPSNSAVHFSLAILLQRLKVYQEAIESYQKTIELDHQNIDAFNNYALLLKGMGQVTEAEKIYKQGILFNPNCSTTYNNLGALYLDTNKLSDAEYYFKKALLLNTQSAFGYSNYGLLLLKQGKFDEAEAFCLKALELMPDYEGAHNNLGLVLINLTRYEESVGHFKDVIRLNPQHYTAMSNITLPLKKLGRLSEAEAYLKKSLELKPDFFDAQLNLGSIYQGQGKILEAINCNLSAIQIKPDSTVAFSNLFFDMCYSDAFSQELVMQRVQEYGNLLNSLATPKYKEWGINDPVDQLRIGFVSGDFIEHPVTYFFRNMLRFFDISKFELFAYSTDAKEDQATKSLKPYFSQWKSLVGLTEAEAAELIHNDNINILIDLSGHTAGNRLPLFAYKPAPVQVSWLGYWATTGVQQIDYIIADEVSLPIAIQNQFTEKVKYIPDTRFCFSPPNFDIAVSELPALKNDYITIGCFQNYAKISDDVLRLWAEVFKSIPNARLRWQGNALKDADVVEALQLRLKGMGIEPERVDLLGSVSRQDYFKSHFEIDFILDSFPFSGCTTTCEGLWMGVPTLTLPGITMVSRQTASFMSAVGLTDWISSTREEFINKAVFYANNLDLLNQIRLSLREKLLNSPVCDGAQFAKNVELALLEMWNESYGNPDSININKDIESNKNLVETILSVKIVSATRMTESDFWTRSALGLSLKEHQKKDARLSFDIAFENKSGLPDVFNQVIAQSTDDDILVFMHDDVWIDQEDFVDVVIAGLKQFDVIGVAGNKRLLPNQPAWSFVDTQFTWDEKSNLSGIVWHGSDSFGEPSYFGPVPAKCEVMDGVFIAVKRQTLISNNVSFDSQFSFHFYDLDFCRTARQANLKLGTWGVRLTHQSGGNFGSDQWQKMYRVYLNKWERITVINHSNSGAITNQAKNADLKDAIDDVMKLAIEHKLAGRVDEEKMLYEEIIKIDPENAEANHNLGVLRAHLEGLDVAFPLLENAVKSDPQKEQYWITYIDALVQSGAIEVAVEALETGQKFGLSRQTAQILCGRFYSKT